MLGESDQPRSPPSRAISFLTAFRKAGAPRCKPLLKSLSASKVFRIGDSAILQLSLAVNNAPQVCMEI